MNFISELKTSLLVTIILLAVCCGVYPVLVWGAAQLIFPRQANGSLVDDADHKPIASTLLAQAFTAPKYFHPRPSAAGTGYDAANSGGSNLGPTSQSLHDAVKQRVSDYRQANGLAETQAVPADAVEASASGLDPHISLKNAWLQLPRVARERGLDVAMVRALMDRCTDGRGLGFLGEPGVNVVKLNLALDGRYR